MKTCLRNFKSTSVLSWKVYYHLHMEGGEGMWINNVKCLTGNVIGAF